MSIDRWNVGRRMLLGASLLACSCLPAEAQTPAAQSAAVQTTKIPARIAGAVDETNRVKLRGNVHPLARAEFDRGRVPADLPMQRMLLVLKRSPEQQTALSQLMADQYNTVTPSFHQWLTPEQFGQGFGPADEDIQAVTAWLQTHGFQVAKVSKGKVAIEFSGTAAQVQETFRTEIHKYVVNGEQHLANASDPQVPAALAPVIHGIASLHNFRPKPMHHVVGAFTKALDTGEVQSVKPEFTTSGGNFAVGPGDFATIYNVLPLWNAASPIDGTGQSIAIIGVSNINLQDVADFRTLFGLATGGTNTPVVVIDGSDPGIVNDGSETEALTDVQWSGAVAKGAQIHFVIAADTDSSSGLLLAALHVLDTNSDPIMSLSFGNCEQSLGTSGNQFFQGVWEQAAAQGITVTVSSGDDGSAGCEDQNATPPHPATTGLQVSGFASTPFNVAVGGTDFNDAGTQTTYFNTNAQNDPTTLLSAKSYIPESTWNESCTNASFGPGAETNCNAAANSTDVITVGGSGGVSHCTVVTGTACSGGYAKPAFQSFTGLTGMPADGHRDLPDVSLFASSGFNKSFYVVCEADDPSVTASASCKKGTSFQFLAIGGTSVSTPSFAGILALVNQKTGQRQGNANFVLYKLAQQQFVAATACTSQASPLPAAGCTFNDVTTGTIVMPCAKGSTDCTTSNAADKYGLLNGYNAGAGYDLATGLGSVNAANLVGNWAAGQAAFRATATTLSITPTTGLTAGQAPFPTVNITVTPTSGSGTPTGQVALVSTAASGEGVDGFTLTNGAVAAATTNQLTGGTYQVKADYPGDGTFAPSSSAAATVTVGKASSTAVATVLSSTGGGNFAAFTSGVAPVTLFLSAVVNPTGVLLPTGTVTFVDTFNGTATPVASTVKLDASGEAFTAAGISTFAAGAHSIVAQYSGDNSFTLSNSAAVTFTITAATTTPTTTTVTPSVTTLASGGSITLTAKVTTTSTGAGPTGTVQFMNGSSALGTAATCAPTAGVGATTAFCTATLTTTLSFLVPPWQTPRPIPDLPVVPMWISACVLLAIFLLSVKRLPMAKRRGYVYAGLLLFACAAAGIAGCSGSPKSASSGGGSTHTDSITAVYGGDANFSKSTSAAVAISVH